jgi:hypothetical protein
MPAAVSVPAMTDRFDSAGFTSLLLMIHLIQRLVFRGTLSREDARELVDLALLEAEEIFGSAPQGQSVRDLLSQFLKDLDRRKPT